MNGVSDDLIADCGGAIEEIAITFPGDLLEGQRPERAALYDAMSAQLSNYAALTVICESPTGPHVTAWARRLSLRRSPSIAACLPADMLDEGGYWIRDPFLCSEAGNQGQYLIPGKAASEGTYLGAWNQTPTSQVPVMMNGGNCLIGDDFWLLGAFALRDTTDSYPQYGKSLVRAEAAFASLSGKTLYVIGTRPRNFRQWMACIIENIRDRIQEKQRSQQFPRPRTSHRGDLSAWARSLGVIVPEPVNQPIRHIDLYISLTGLKVNGKRLLLVGEPKTTTNPKGPTDKDFDAKIMRSLDSLSRNDFEIWRNPMPLLLPPGVNSCPSNIDCRELRFYNNVLVQNDPAVVWLPQFGDQELALRDMDEANRKIWSDLGFTVEQVYGWSTFVTSHGAVHCATKVLKRAAINSVGPQKSA